MEQVSTSPASGFSSRVRSAVFWRSGSQILAQLVMWGSTLAVVRLLEPTDYGLFAMTQVVLAIFTFLNGYSFASSLVQAESIDERRIRQAFGLLILLNGGLALTQFLTAPLAAAYFRQPIIEEMLKLQCVIYLVTPFIAVPSAVLARSLDFKKQAAANMAGALAGALTSLLCAISGFGVWTLVWAPVALFTVRAIGLTIAARIIVLPSFDLRDAGHLLGFGGALMLCQFFWLIQSQADVFLAGRTFNPHDLGLYAEALFLTQIFTAKFIPPVNEVAFPAYAELHKKGGQIGDAFLTSARITMFVALPLYVGMAAVAGPLVETLFGPKWIGMAPLVQGLALAMPFFALQIVHSPATNALGNASVYLRTSIAGALIMPAAFSIGIMFGVDGLVAAWWVAAPALLVVTMRLTLPRIDLSIGDLMRAIAPTVFAALCMGAAVAFAEYEITLLPAPAELAVLVLLGGAIYLGLLWRYARPLIEQLYALLTQKQLPGSVPQAD